MSDTKAVFSEGYPTQPETFRVPYTTGDQLWVREAWRADKQLDKIRPAQMCAYEPVLYEADQMVRTMACSMIAAGKLRPSMFMPRWVSRLTLTVTNIRIERLQDISEEDAIAEGAPLDTSFCDHPRHTCAEVGCLDRTHKANFCNIWNEINGATAWDANPWVIALTFTVQHGNIDEVAA